MYLTLVTLHVLAAVTWLGGIGFLALVGAPALRRVEPPSLRAELFEAIGMRFRVVGWSAVSVLLVTGVWLLYVRGWLSSAILLAPEFWRSSVGTALAWKLGCVTAMVVLSLAHDVASTSTRGRAATAGDEAGAAMRRRLMLLARVGALGGVGAVAAAIRLVRP